ncbi:MAG: acyl-CoA dehydrogenase [Gammaproteobacteria bacterium]|nr:acyl-CoA dehydrogenase [Gammaproteobacteria bacterium]MBI5619027.1 acyl-CoA dehydrogenase [Gammaproteobacteria bacterium]
MNRPDAELAGQRELLRDSARSFCQRDLAAGRLHALRAAKTVYDHAAWAAIAELGWTGILVPEAAGGLELGLADAAIVAEELGRVVAPEPFVETAIAATALAALGTTPAIEELLSGIAAGTAIVVLSTGARDVDELPRVESQDGNCVLEGIARHVPLAEAADAVLLACRVGGRAALLHLPRTTPGIDRLRAECADGSHHTTLRFESTTLPAAALLASGPEADAALAVAGDAARLLTAAYAQGLASAALDLTRAYLGTRVQFGRRLGSFQALQHRAVDLLLHRELTAATLDAVLEEYTASADPLERTVLASRAAHRALVGAVAITRDAVQMHGAIGFTQECDVGLYLNRALVLAARCGHAGGQLARVARLASARIEAVTATGGARSVQAPADGDWEALSDEDFRTLVRAWFEAEYPADLRYPPRRLHWNEIKEWSLKLSRQGWLAPNWPREYGGMGLGPSKLMVFIEEQERWGVARAPDMGITMVGPLLIKHGTPEQRSAYLPKILAGENIWCQGYSEPNAGSDLASLRTEAIIDGDDFVVTGQKTWTTLAQDATHIFLLVRTDKAAKKQAGISFLLVDMNTPGITVRPIRNLAGNPEFCELFFDAVRVPRANLVGEMNKGWTIAKALLGFERVFLGSPKQSQYALQRLARIATERGLFADAAFSERYTRLRLDVLDLEAFYRRFAAIVKSGGTLGPEVSLLKIWATETYARLTEAMLEAAGPDGGTLGQVAFGASEIDAVAAFYNARPATIYGGANEIQRNIVAKGVLDLPDE